MDSKSKFYVAGNTGLVGSAIVRMLKKKRFYNIISSPSSHWDLTVQSRVEQFFRINQPEYVFLAAAKVGGIGANSESPAHFIYDNLMIQTNIIDCAYRYGAKKLIFLGSSCIYPKFANQPIKEEELMTGALEPSNDAYATAKIAGIKMCQAYRQQYGFNAISVMPTNLYGPNDNYDLEKSHVLPAMIRKFHEAEDKVTLWGDGSARREFLHVDDLAEALYLLLNQYNEASPINVGTGEDVTIKELAETVGSVVGNKEIEWDTSKPNGTPRKVLDVSKIKSMGWKPTISLRDGIESTYQDYIK
jgi:GDP-L-fucose synthase|tara:strand:+ start:343 stop:1248 length:906 start_codon:yes stop_codon:yes gene_type:complete